MGDRYKVMQTNSQQRYCATMGECRHGLLSILANFATKDSEGFQKAACISIRPGHNHGHLCCFQDESEGMNGIETDGPDDTDQDLQALNATCVTKLESPPPMQDTRSDATTLILGNPLGHDDKDESDQADRDSEPNMP